MELVLVFASVLLLATVAVAVALDRGPFASTPPSEFDPPSSPPPPAPSRGPGLWAGYDSSVRACDDLQSQLQSGRLSCADYRRAMGDLAASYERRHPMPIPPDR